MITEEAYWQKRAAELVAHPMFPPDEHMPARYLKWRYGTAWCDREPGEEG